MKKFQSLYSKRFHYSYHPATGLGACGVKINAWAEDNKAVVTCKKCLHLKKYAPDVAPVTSAEPDSGSDIVPAVESDTQPRG